jgi:hypothetical protein
MAMDGSVLEPHSGMISELNFKNKVLDMTNKRYLLKTKDQLSI